MLTNNLLQTLYHYKGTNLRFYFEQVAQHHGLEYAVEEYSVAEDPGSSNVPTFYVTNMREPVSRSISGFKCKRIFL